MFYIFHVGFHAFLVLLILNFNAKDLGRFGHMQHCSTHDNCDESVKKKKEEREESDDQLSYFGPQKLSNKMKFGFCLWFLNNLQTDWFNHSILAP